MKDSTAVLFVHGIQGSPEQFRFLIDALPSGIETRNLRLPGHGADAMAFRSSGRADWLAAVRRETEELLQEGRRIVLVGHSMGCLLGLLCSDLLGDPYRGMLLLCCPFRVRPTFRYLSIGLRAARPERPGEDPAVTATRAANSVYLRRSLEQLTLLHPYADLLRLMGQTRSAGPECPTKLRFFFSERDEIVSPRSRDFAAAYPNAAVRVLPGCTHNYFNNEARQLLRRTLLSMISEGTT